MLESLISVYSEINHYWVESSLFVLFISGFLSATLLPGGSEAALFATLNLHQYSPIVIIIIATLGNSFGGITNYVIGLWIPERTQRKKDGPSSLIRVKKYGYWALMFSWLPVIGDAICVAAGWMRMKFLPSFILIFIGKATRYAVLTIIFYGLF